MKKISRDARNGMRRFCAFVGMVLWLALPVSALAGGAGATPANGERDACTETGDRQAACADRSIRSDAPPPAVSFLAMDASHGDTCGVRTNGALSCWGGRLAAMTPKDGRFLSVRVARDRACAIRDDGVLMCWQSALRRGTGAAPQGRYLSLDVGDRHACAIRSDGHAVCWGADERGQSTVPHDLRAIALAVGDRHSCAIRQAGTVVCWGDDYSGRSAPPQGRYTAIHAIGSRTCARNDTGITTCWGAAVRVEAPAASAADGARNGVGTIVAGDAHTCALGDDGRIACWGDDRLSQGSAPAGSFRTIDASGDHGCGIASEGAIRCWGDDSHAGSTPAPGAMREIDIGHFNGCGVRDSGEGVCWGWNANGQSVPPMGAFRRIATGLNHSCGVRDDGTLACWGYNADSQGDAPAGRYRDIDVGERHSCAIASDGALHCWGLNSEGQAKPPVSAAGFRAIAAGAFHNCAIDGDGGLTCWGRGSNGQTSSPTNVPTDAPTDGTFVSVAAGFAHSCAIRDDGQSVCWGDNGFGQSARVPARDAQLQAADTTPPVITRTITGTLGENGWYISDVRVQWSVVDPESPVTIIAGCQEVLLTTDTQGQNYECTARSEGSRLDLPPTSDRVTLKRDTVAPVATVTLPEPSPAGWHRTDVVARYGCIDATSGVPSGCTNVVSVLSEGTTIVGHQVRDAAGHLSAEVLIPVRIDKTPPTLSANMPAGTLVLNQAFDLNLSASDALSGLDTARTGCTPVATQPISQQTTCAAYDLAGNASVRTTGYSVVYVFEGFLAPLGRGEVMYEVEVERKVPILWKLRDANGLLRTEAAFGWVEYGTIQCPALPIVRVDWRGPYTRVGEEIVEDGKHRIFWHFYSNEANKCYRVNYFMRDQTMHSEIYRVVPRRTQTGGPGQPLPASAAARSAPSSQLPATMRERPRTLRRGVKWMKTRMP
jgi:alpha-tubulin suppressor-like RCC1 family protein